MSEYSWETDKEEDAAPTLGDGGDLEEVKHKVRGLPFNQSW